MNQKEVFKKIGGIINELNDQYELLQTETSDLSDLEIEIFVANAHFLADHAEILYKLNLQNRNTAGLAEKPETKHEPKYFEPVVQQMRHTGGTPETKSPLTPSNPLEVKVSSDNIPEDRPAPEIDLHSETPIDNYAIIRDEPETIRHELILDETQNWDDEEEYVNENEELKDSEESETNDNERVILSYKEPDIRPSANNFVADAKDKTADEETVTINQKISAQLGNRTTGIVEQLGVKPISDIKLAITLNDKLLFVKDLFNGYNLAYSEAIEILNRFNTFEEAMRFLNTNYITKNNWESKPETSEKFYALLKRRYA